DRRVDVYAMGVILYEMIAGTPPFEGRNYFELLWKHGNEAPPKVKELNPNVYVTDGVEAVIRRALAKDPDKRHQTMAELELALVAAAPEIEPLPSLPSLPPAKSTPSGSAPGIGHARTEHLDPSSPKPVNETAEVQLPERNPWPFVAVALGAVLLAGSLVYAFTESDGDAVPHVDAPTPTDEPPIAADPVVDPRETSAIDDPPDGVDPPATPPERHVEIRSNPAGAEIVRDGETLGTTPMTVTLPASGEPIELSLSRDGYLSETIAVDPGPEPSVPEVRLRRRRGPSVPNGQTSSIKTGM
ncbi:MAG: PEGA domain-containing protein, partial [Sandaracinaceae bacterium]